MPYDCCKWLPSSVQCEYSLLINAEKKMITYLPKAERLKRCQYQSIRVKVLVISDQSPVWIPSHFLSFFKHCTILIFLNISKNYQKSQGVKA